MDLKLTNTYDRLREHYELSDQEVDHLRSLPLKEMFTITEALNQSNYKRLDELISTVRALGQGTANKMKPTIGKIGKGAGMAGDAIKTTGAYRGAANTANKVGQGAQYVGTQTAKGYDDYQQAKNAVKNKIGGKLDKAKGALGKVGGAMSNIASQIKGNIQTGMGAGQNNDALGAVRGTTRVTPGSNLANTDMDDLGFELDQVDQDSLAKNMVPQQDPKTGQVTQNVNLKKNDALRVVDMDKEDPTKPITLATRDNKKIKVDPKTGAKVESKEKIMKAKELNESKADPAIVAKFAKVSPSQRSYYVMKWAEENGMDTDEAMEKAGYEKGGYMGAGAYNWKYVGEAVGDFADPIYDLIDELGDSSIVLDNLIRYLDGDTIKDFVEDFRRHHDMNDIDEGSKNGNDEDEIDDEAGEVPMLDKDFDDDDELNEIRRLAGMKETTTSGSIAGTTDGFGTVAQHRSLIRRFQKQNKKK